MSKVSRARAFQIERNVLAALQDAEELGGPHLYDYIAMCERLLAELHQRQKNATQIYNAQVTRKPGRAIWEYRFPAQESKSDSKAT